MNDFQVWASLVCPGGSQEPFGIVERARQLEADGWNGGFLADSQLKAAETFTVLALCAAATTRLKIGTGTSNPATRHPSVLASAVAALQIASGGRMTLGIGRGDSSLADIGASPVPLAYFERSLKVLQAYLSGGTVTTEDASSFLNNVPCNFDKLAIDGVPTASRLNWLSQVADYVKPELEVAATGPKVIAMAAMHADRIAFALGANVERLKWAIGQAREALERAGRDPASVEFAAFIPLYPHPDQEFAIQLSRGIVASMSRFSILNKTIVGGPISDEEKVNFERIAKSYDMTNHGDSKSKQSDVMDASFVEKFGLVGDPQVCADRLIDIASLGINKINVWTADTHGQPGESYQLATNEVLPKVMAAMS